VGRGLNGPWARSGVRGNGLSCPQARL
jgi:hypothetical protein